MTAAAVGRAGSDALRAVAGAYRDYGRAHPGRYAATVRAPQPDDADHTAAAAAVLRVVFAVLAGYGITGDDAIDAARALRAALHGFVTLEAGGGFGMPRDIDRSYQRFITAFDTALSELGRAARPARRRAWPPEAAAPGVLTGHIAIEVAHRARAPVRGAGQVRTMRYRPGCGR